ncbi:MAG: hypothetical protein GX096_14565 [Clostridiales bacterium]|nr:hypothetical protein [Clostridiales bacterium]
MPDKKRNRDIEVDDDYVVADMNIEGLPWYRKEEPSRKNPNAEPMSKRSMWRYTFVAVGAGLTIVFIFGILGAAFIWFCNNIWFR